MANSECERLESVVLFVQFCSRFQAAMTCTMDDDVSSQSATRYEHELPPKRLFILCLSKIVLGC